MTSNALSECPFARAAVGGGAAGGCARDADARGKPVASLRASLSDATTFAAGVALALGYCATFTGGSMFAKSGTAAIIYNTVCRNRNLTGFHNGIWSHEGFGTKNPADSSVANGHEARRRIIASKPSGDPYKLGENLISATKAGLIARFAFGAWGADIYMTNFAADSGHAFVNGNWCGKIWVWSIAQSRYVDYQFVMDNGKCL